MFTDSIYITFTALIIINFVLNLILFIAWSRIKRKTFSADGLTAEFSIIIAAKNEEKKLPALFQALKNLNYPANMFEIIFIDDNSTDRTHAIAESMKKDFPNLKIINSSAKPFDGKKGALAVGINNSSKEYILLTDADCEPEADWLKAFNSKFNDDYDFLIGTAPLKLKESFANNAACFDNLRSGIMTLAAAELGFPYNAASRNCGFKRTAYESISGFNNTLETVSGDDDLLLREAVKKKFRIGTTCGDKSAVISFAPKSFRELMKQRARHTKTSLYYLPSRKLILGIWHSANILLLFSPLFAAMHFSLLFILPIKLITDWMLISYTQKKFGYRFNIIKIIYLQILYEILIVANFVLALLKKTEWK